MSERVFNFLAGFRVVLQALVNPRGTNWRERIGTRCKPTIQALPSGAKTNAYLLLPTVRRADIGHERLCEA